MAAVRTITVPLGWLGWLGVILVAGKVFGAPPVASWSWLWVTAPFWSPFALLFAVGMIFGLAWGILTYSVGRRRVRIRKALARNRRLH